MSVLFCHDHRFFVDASGRIFSYGQFDHDILERYVSVFGHVTIAARCQPLPHDVDAGRLSLCSSGNVSFLPMPNLSSLAGLTVGRPGARRRLAKAIEKADAVIARLPSEIGLLALAVARHRRKPAAAEVVACIWDGLMSHGSLTARLYAPVAYRRMRRAVAGLDRVLYVTRTFLQDRYPCAGATTSVSNVDLPPPDAAVLETRLARIAEDHRPLTFGMIAALFHKEKGIGVAIDAFAAARAQAPGIKLKILGPGDPAIWAEMVTRHGLADDIEFCGTLPRGNAVLDWLDDIDVYVQASFQEGLPRALIEAMSRACPALASSAGGTDELTPPECGHTPGDRSTLAAQMLRALDPGWRRDAAMKNFAASAHYGRDILNVRRKSFWKSFLAVT